MINFEQIVCERGVVYKFSCDFVWELVIVVDLGKGEGGWRVFRCKHDEEVKSSTNQKRPRGRPKGSKNKKPLKNVARKC